MTLEWPGPALLLASAAAGLSVLQLKIRRKRREAPERFNVFSLINAEGEPFPPFDEADRWWSFVGPLSFGVAALVFLAIFFGIL